MKSAAGRSSRAGAREGAGGRRADHQAAADPCAGDFVEGDPNPSWLGSRVVELAMWAT